MKQLLELQKQIEIDFLKEHSYEQINDMFRELKSKLNNAESKVKNFDTNHVIQQHELLVAFNKEMAELHSWFLPASNSMIDEFLTSIKTK